MEVLEQFLELKSLGNVGKRSPMRCCEDLLSLLSLSEEQTNSLMKRIDNGEVQDVAYYAQYLVKKVKKGVICRKQFM